MSGFSDALDTVLDYPEYVAIGTDRHGGIYDYGDLLDAVHGLLAAHGYDELAHEVATLDSRTKGMDMGRALATADEVLQRAYQTAGITGGNDYDEID